MLARWWRSDAVRLAAVGVVATVGVTVTAVGQTIKADGLERRVTQLEQQRDAEHAAAVAARADADAAKAKQRRAEDDAADAQRRLAEAAERERARVVRASRSRRLVGPSDVPTPETPSGAAAWVRSRDAVRVAACESGGNPRAVNPHGAGYYGKWQFALATWRSVGGRGNPVDATEAEQDHRAWLLWKRDGWGQWECAGKLGIR